MKLAFLFTPVTDLRVGLTGYPDTMGRSQARREGETTVGPDPTAMYEVDSVDKFLATSTKLDIRVGLNPIPDGFVASFADPSSADPPAADPEAAELEAAEPRTGKS